MFKVDNQAPRRVVQCLLAYKLIRHTTTDHLKRGCTNTSNSPGNRTRLQTCKQANKQNKAQTDIDCRTTGLTNTVPKQRRKMTTRDTCQQTHPREIASPPICNRTNRDQKQTTTQARQSKTRQTQRKTGKNDRTKPNGVESKTGTTTKTRHAKGKHGRQNGEAPLGWKKAEHNG